MKFALQCSVLLVCVFVVLIVAHYVPDPEDALAGLFALFAMAYLFVQFDDYLERK